MKDDTQKQPGIAMLISAKLAFKPKMARDKDGQYIMIKEAIH